MSRIRQKYEAKIFGKYQLDSKGKPKTNLFGDKLRTFFGEVLEVVTSISHKPWEGKYSDMLEMKAFRLKQLEKRQ